MTKSVIEPLVTFEPLIVEVKGNIISFKGKYSKEQLEAYSFGIEQVLDDAAINYSPKREDGRNGGAQEWEVIGEINADYLKKLIPSIHILAEEYSEETMWLRGRAKRDEVLG